MDLFLWIKCLVMKLIWNIRSKKDSLWVKWVHEVMLKRKSFWGIKIPMDFSWIWRKLLKLMPVAQSFIQNVTENGLQTNFWYDAGILWDRYSCSFQKIHYTALGATHDKVAFIMKTKNGSGLKIGKCQRK